MRVATCFSGGLAAPEFSLKYLGIKHEVVFACEWDKYARQQYIQFHGEPKKFYNDASALDATPYKDKVDLFVFGSPCQDLSLAGKRKGFDGVKSSLFREGARIMNEMMPSVFIFENVKGLLSSNNGNDYKEVLKTFQDMGYLIASSVLNTKDFEIPQNRERVFIVGFLDEDQYHSFSFPDPKPLVKRLRDMLEDDVDEKYYLKEKTLSKFEFIYGSENQIGKIGGEVSKEHNSITNRIFDIDKLSPTLTTAATGGNQQVKILVPSATISGYETAENGDSINISHLGSATGRGRVGTKQSQTLTTECNMCTVEYGRVRKLTPKECFRLQGVRDKDIDLVVSDTQAYKIAGNAITVNVMMAIIDNIVNPKSNGGLF